MFIHVTLVPYIKSSGEHKSKPTQHSVKELQAMGISPTVIVCRCDEPIETSVLHKIASFCNVKEDCVIENITLPVLYQAPMMLEKNGLAKIVCRELQIACAEPDMTEWNQMLTRIENRTKDVTIAIVGKYVRLHDAYLSVAEALQHAGFENSARVHLTWIEAEDVTDDTAAELLGGCDGILVPGGFEDRGIEGKLRRQDTPEHTMCPILESA